MSLDKLKVLHKWQKVMWCQNKVTTKCRCWGNCTPRQRPASTYTTNHNLQPKYQTWHTSQNTLHGICNKSYRRHKSHWNDEPQHMQKFTNEQRSSIHEAHTRALIVNFGWWKGTESHWHRRDTTFQMLKGRPTKNQNHKQNLTRKASEKTKIEQSPASSSQLGKWASLYGRPVCWKGFF